MKRHSRHAEVGENTNRHLLNDIDVKLLIPIICAKPNQYFNSEFFTFELSYLP
jgi:hypothetical protein